jgi:hypothetical protein
MVVPTRQTACNVASMVALRDTAREEETINILQIYCKTSIIAFKN